MAEDELYKKLAKYYDKIYYEKDYKKEVEFINWAANKYKKTSGNNLLDVACGTCSHAVYLKDDYSILGVDLSSEMLELAKKKVKGMKFQVGDMKTLRLKKQFDVILCMFTSMAYNMDYAELENTLGNFYNHLLTGGVLIFDLGIHKDYWLGGKTWINTYVDENLQIARISQSPMKPKDGIFESNMLYLIKEKGKVDFEIDEVRLGVFEPKKIQELMRKIGFKSYIYVNFTQKLWRKNIKGAVVFVGVK
jgi:SAM-dependent methyltransferase